MPFVLVHADLGIFLGSLRDSNGETDRLYWSRANAYLTEATTYPDAEAAIAAMDAWPAEIDRQKVDLRAVQASLTIGGQALASVYDCQRAGLAGWL